LGLAGKDFIFYHRIIHTREIDMIKLKSIRLSIYVQICIILLLACGTGIVYNHLSPAGIPLLDLSPAVVEAGEINTERAYTLFQQGTILFVDTRISQQYEQQHIQHAVNVPSSWSMDQIMDFFKVLPRDRPLVIYCSQGCNSDRRLAGFLIQIEFLNVSLLDGGFEKWVSSGYPLEIGIKNPE
jgi:rhodanese-related sulfurtransferase